MNQPATASLPAARPIVSSQKGSFAWTALAQRHPTLIEQVRAAHPSGPGQLARLDALHEEITSGTIRPPPDTAHDHAAWRAWSQPDGDGRSYYGQSWFDVPFLCAESYFYRRLLDVVGLALATASASSHRRVVSVWATGGQPPPIGHR